MRRFRDGHGWRVSRITNAAASAREHLHRACAPVTAFLVPGALGADPPLENLRTRLSDEVRLDLVDMPDIGRPGSVIASIPATAEIVAADIVRRRPSGALSLLGFSFGGSVALEVATQLTRAGCDIAFLGILDAPFKGSACAMATVRMSLPWTGRGR